MMNQFSNKAVLSILKFIFILAALLLGLHSAVQAQERSFAIGRYTPTPAGEWSFWADYPWYSRTRSFAAGLTLDYAHDPLVYRETLVSGDTRETSVIEHHMLMHFDLAASFHDRFTVSASLPLTVVEDGTAVAVVGPEDPVTVGDPRIGLMIRVFGQPDESPLSLHVGAHVWIPVRDDGNSGDRQVRALPKLVLAGRANWLRWSLNGGFLSRAEGAFPLSTQSTVGSELQFGALLQYADRKRRFAIGPEAVLATVVNDSHAFEERYTTMELLGGVHYNIARKVQIGIAGGTGLLREPGTPDFRGLLRLAYAPLPAPKRPAPADRDHDGIVDTNDQCPDEAMGERPDLAHQGCPLRDSDGDGVYDDEDICIDERAGERPDPQHPGCPLRDRDGDGVSDNQDACIDVPAGVRPDPERLGCPLPDTDGDGIVDPEDACVDQAGVANTDPNQNGCPALATVEEGQITILQQIFFATNKDEILPESFPVLTAVADVLKTQPQITQVIIEGHTDSDGNAKRNQRLSQKRAEAVQRWLIEQGGIAAERLSAKGVGEERPIDSNETAEGKAKNRRVEFKIVESPPQP